MTGKKTGRTATESRRGPIMQNMKEHTKMERNTALELSSGLTNQFILVNSSITISMAKASTLGLTEGNTKVNGETIKCMEKEHSFGQMAVSISVNI